MDVGNAPVNLGASVNIIPLLVLKKIGDLEIEPNVTTIEMKDITCRKPMGIIKDILIKI